MEGKRRISDHIIDAFDMACENKDVEVAELLYRTLEIVLTRQDGPGAQDKRLNVEFIHDAANRLGKLRERKAA